MKRLGVIALVLGGLTVGVAAPAAAAPPPRQMQVPAPAVPGDGQLGAPAMCSTAGPDGNAWFRETDGVVAKVTPERVVTEFVIPNAPLSAIPTEHCLTAGPGGALWLSLPDRIDRLTTSGTFTEFLLPALHTAYKIAAGPDGRLWFLDLGSSGERRLGKMTTDGEFTFVDVPIANFRDLFAGGGGDMWIVGDNGLGTYTAFRVVGDTLTPLSTTIPLTSGTAGADGNAWIGGGQQLARITPGGSITSFPSFFPTTLGVTAATDGALWFPASPTAVSRMTTYGDEIFLDLDPVHPATMTATNDGLIWFTDSATNVVYYLSITLTVAFVENVYADALHRPVDLVAKEYWVTLLLLGYDTGVVAGALVQSDEYRTMLVEGAYEYFLDRPGDPGGVAYWAGLLLQGHRIEELNSLFVGSDEYFVTQGNSDNADYITAAYNDLVHRDPDPDGFAYWLNLLDSGANRGAVGNALVFSKEALGNVVVALYQQYLERDPDAGGLEYWTAQLLAGMHDENLIILLTASEEYFFKG